MKSFVLNILFGIVLAFTTSCTYNISMAHTEGSAVDIIDDNATNTPTVSPKISVPLAPLP